MTNLINSVNFDNGRQVLQQSAMRNRQLSQTKDPAEKLAGTADAVADLQKWCEKMNQADAKRKNELDETRREKREKEERINELQRLASGYRGMAIRNPDAHGTAAAMALSLESELTNLLFEDLL